jgi:transposase InsO family protein
MIYPVVRELAGDGIPVATACRVLEVSTSGFYEWDSRPASDRAWDQAHLMHAIREAHAASYGTYGHRRVHAELVLGQHLSVSHGRVERLMRCAGLQGVHRRRLRGCTRRDRAATPTADLVERNFRPAAPDRLYVADITQHRTSEGWFYLAVVLDCFSRRVVGWAMADHIRSELVVDALQMAIWNRRPAPRRDPSQRPRLDLHQLGLRAPAAGGRAARLDGQHRGLFRQLGRGELLRDPADRAARPLELADP